MGSDCEGLRREAEAVTVLPSLLTRTSSAPALRLRSENSAAPEGTLCAVGCGTPCATKVFSCSAIACVHAWATRGSRAVSLEISISLGVSLDFGTGPAFSAPKSPKSKKRPKTSPFDIPAWKSFGLTTNFVVESHRRRRALGQREVDRSLRGFSVIAEASTTA